MLGCKQVKARAMEVFHSVDLDGCGTLDVSELRECFKWMGMLAFLSANFKHSAPLSRPASVDRPAALTQTITRFMWQFFPRRL